MKKDCYRTKIRPGETLTLSDGEVYVCAYSVDVDDRYRFNCKNVCMVMLN